MASRKASIGAELRMDSRQWKAGLNQGRSDLNSFKRDAERMKIAGPSTGRWTEFNSRLQVASVGLRGVGLAGQAAAAFFRSDMGIEGLSRSLAAVTRDSQSLKSQMNSLAKVAAGPGIDFSSAVQGSAALQSVGMSAKESQDALEQWSNAVAASAGGAEELKGVIVALRQIMSKPSVQQEDVNQILERVGSFAGVAAKLESLKTKPAAWVKAATEELEKMPRVAAGAKESVDSLKDSFEQWKLGTTGGKAGKMGSAAANYGSAILKNGFRMSDAEDFMRDAVIKPFGIGDDLVDHGSQKSPLDAMQPSDADLKKRRDDWQKTQDSIQKAREILADKHLKSQQSELDVEKQLADARNTHDKDAIRALEQKLYLMQNVESLAKELGVSKKFITDRLKDRLKTEQEIEDIGKREATANTVSQSKADMLRFRGHGKQADKLERKDREQERVNQLLDTTNLSREDAQHIAAGESAIQSGRKRIGGAVRSPRDKSGFAIMGNSNLDGGMKSQASGLMRRKISDEQPFSSIDYFKIPEDGGRPHVKSQLNEKRKKQGSTPAAEGKGVFDTAIDIWQRIEENTRKTPAEKHAARK